MLLVTQTNSEGSCSQQLWERQEMGITSGHLEAGHHQILMEVGVGHRMARQEWELNFLTNVFCSLVTL